MSVSRRRFVRSLTTPTPSAPWIAARGREAWVGEHSGRDLQAAPPSRALAMRLNSNENPLGPSAAARRAIENAFGYAGRYPMNAVPSMADFRELVARRNGVKLEHVALGAGSGEILEMAVRAFTSRSAGLVSAVPTFESPARVAREIAVPLTEVTVDVSGRLDLERMATASIGAGMVFLCNPNNPTGSVHGAQAIKEIVARIRRTSRDTVILVDEAYHDYVTEPSYATAMPLASEHPNVIVSRTLSKAHGMAGLRLGYAVGQPKVIEKLSRWMMPFNANALVLGAATVSLEDEAQLTRERSRNTEARRFAMDFFHAAGMKMTDSQANFIWVDLDRPAKGFRDACEKQGVLVGRDFPPFEKTHCRISIGTMDEMKRALTVFRAVLGAAASTEAGGRG